MKILDQNNNEIDKFDENQFKIIKDRIFIKHHDFKPKIEEKSHFETVKEYDNGGKDVKKIIDQEYSPEREAFDEYEDIWRLVPLSEIEKAENEIAFIKDWFNDYYTIHEQQFRRLHTLGNPSAYDRLISLYEEAETKRAKIHELEAVIGVL